MAVTNLAATTARLVDAGRDPGTPVAVVEDGYGAGQRVTVGRLDQIAARAAEVGVRAPAVVVVGDVVTLSPHWSPQASWTWRPPRPLGLRASRGRCSPRQDGGGTLGP